MTLSAADQRLVDAMKQRELHLKRRQRAADAIQHRTRRRRVVIMLVTGLAVLAVEIAIVVVAAAVLPERTYRWVPLIGFGVASAAVGVLLGHRLLGTARGRRMLAAHESRLRHEYTGDLHAGRRWLSFYHDGEDISAYVGQVLYSIEEEGRFHSVDEALAFAKQRRTRGAVFAEHARAAFDDVEGQVNLVVVSSSDEAGWPSSRLMRFVTSGRRGVWYVTTAPDGPKVREFDRGRVAVVTPPTPSGATISSNRARIRRAGVGFPEVADLYRAQVPGYADGMTEDEQRRELVYEVTLRSARVDTWFDREAVELDGADPAAPPPGTPPAR